MGLINPLKDNIMGYEIRTRKQNVTHLGRVLKNGVVVFEASGTLYKQVLNKLTSWVVEDKKL